MCGIVAYVGDQQAYPIILKGLKTLEYRGYDSAGVALLNNKVNVYKKQGKVSALEEFAKDKDLVAKVGMGHTRWATHGAPTDLNAHPHISGNGKYAIIHNGIIENYDPLRRELISRGHKFLSETDTEVVVHLIEEIKTAENCSIEEAFRLALKSVVGAYAIVLIDEEHPNRLIAAKRSSLLIIGIKGDEYFISSDATPIVEYTKDVIYLEDDQIAIIEKGKEIRMVDIDNKPITPYVEELEVNLETIEKDGYEHFMLKEIFEQPSAVRSSMLGRIDPETKHVRLRGIDEYESRFLRAKRIIFVACGTSWHASLVAEYMIEDLARIPVEVEYASEFRYRNPILSEDDIVIAISQSGETADTLAALSLAKEKGAMIYGICNVVGSSIARETDAGSYTHAGPEIGVASTKAFTSQLTILALIALSLAKKKGSISKSRYNTLITELDNIPALIEQTLKTNEKIFEIAKLYKDARNFLYLGRGYNFPIALEGALKLKEISYIHAEGYPAAEVKHGPIALIDENMPVVVIATKRTNYDKLISNIREIKARNAKVIAIVTEGDVTVSEIADHVIEVPATEEFFDPIISVVPLQLLSYHIAVMRGTNVDQPRNLAKAVTVE